ncbi:MAG: hypothetical protein K8M05_26705 [Deltaproteobacteria bacterium]|nr:hypothetical protein [Kofleriaceae bacterium]
MGTAVFWAIVITGIFASRKLFPHWWARSPTLPYAPRPALPEGLPPGTKDARAIKLEDAQPGDYVAVVGRVGPRADLAAPVSKRPCVASDIVISDPQTGDRITRVLRATSFTLDTGGTQAVVDARGAFVRLQHDLQAREIDSRQLEPGILAPDPGGRRVAVFEGIIAPGEYVLVIGVVEKPTAGDEVGYRTSADVRLRIAGGGGRPSVVSTLPGDLRAVL